MRKDIQEYYRALNLSPGATPMEIRRSYRRLIRQWHPDLFKARSIMQMTAEDMAKEINEAFDQLYKKKLYRKFPSREKTVVEPEDPDSEGSIDGDDAKPEPPKAAAPPPPTAKTRPPGRKPRTKASAAPKRPQPKPVPKTKSTRRWMSWPWGKAAIVFGLVLAGLAIWKEMSAPSREPPTVAFEQRSLESSSLQNVAVPVAVAKDQPRVETPPSIPNQAAISPPAESFARSDSHDTPAHSYYQSFLSFSPIEKTMADSISLSADSGKVVEAVEALLDTFGMGDSRDRVIALQGEPDEARGSILRYGSSLVYFDEKGRVRGWADRWPRLRVLVWPSLDQLSIDTFALGSSRPDVIRAMGWPTAVRNLDYNYGSSVVRFRNDRVIDWSQGDTPLRTFDMASMLFDDLSSP